MLSETTKRVLTGLILAPIIIFIVSYLPPIYFTLIITLVLLLAVSEWCRLINLPGILIPSLYVLFFIVLFVASYYLFLTDTATAIFYTKIFEAILIVVWLLIGFWILSYARTLKGFHHRGILIFIGIIIFYGCWLGINAIRWLPEGAGWALYLLLLVWIADSSAYFVGRKWGKHKLIPSVSPGKSIEGVVGALLFSLVFAILGIFIFKLDQGIALGWILLTLVTVLISIVGDLSISVMKRQSKIKDSGNLLPGHGGVLDRIDSLLAAVPFFYIGLRLIGIY